MVLFLVREGVLYIVCCFCGGGGEGRRDGAEGVSNGFLYRRGVGE